MLFHVNLYCLQGKRNAEFSGKAKSRSLPFYGMNSNLNLPESQEPRHETTSLNARPLITLPDFLNLIQLKTAKVVSAVPVPNKDKLYHLELEVGSERRTIVSGIREWYPNPEELVGKTIAILYNLEPKKLGGVMSQGMLLAALDDEGKFSLLVAEKPVKSGAEIR